MSRDGRQKAVYRAVESLCYTSPINPTYSVKPVNSIAPIDDSMQPPLIYDSLSPSTSISDTSSVCLSSETIYSGEIEFPACINSNYIYSGTWEKLTSDKSRSMLFELQPAAYDDYRGKKHKIWEALVCCIILIYIINMISSAPPPPLSSSPPRTSGVDCIPWACYFPSTLPMGCLKSA